MSCYICSNCTDCIDGNIVDKSCMIVTDHDSSLCIENNSICADWKIIATSPVCKSEVSQ